ncbi:MAG: hypothetical protein UGF43_12945 [Blautia sp.]|uniref:hypothetical protein n=1 Tax=Blautia sp. TaxID=1955243 RepID=UPI002E787686|nr:hypothetical protein [Blautia sp.]MEE1444500.1 hypothetical protein [Blautia sp.]
MGESIVGIKISELPEASQSQITDTNVMVVDNGTATRKTKLSTLISYLKSKMIKNSLTQETTGYALDATQGKKLKEEIDALNSSLINESYQPIYVDQETGMDFCYARLKNGYVNLQGKSDKELTIPANTYFEFTTLPKKYRPTVNMYFPMIASDNTISMFGVIYSDTGIIKIYSTKQTSWWRYSVTYPNE